MLIKTRSFLKKAFEKFPILYLINPFQYSKSVGDRPPTL